MIFSDLIFLAEDVSLQRNVLGYLRCVINCWPFRDIEETYLKIVSLESIQLI